MRPTDIHWGAPMIRLLDKKAWRTIGFVAVATIGLSGSWTTVSAQAPESEIARLNRVRANLFEELVKTRAEAAAARAELDAAIKAREHAEAELARLKQEAASAKPASPPPVRQTSVGPQQQVSTDTSTKPQSRPAGKASRSSGQRSVSIGPTTTASVPRSAAAGSQPRAVRASTPRRTAPRPAGPALSRPAASTARPQELPSVLRLQSPQ
jgi:hypothetical protein